MVSRDALARITSNILASHIARMNIARYMVFLALGMLLGTLLASLVMWLFVH